jgi:hypothetical protein
VAGSEERGYAMAANKEERGDTWVAQHKREWGADARGGGGTERRERRSKDGHERRQKKLLWMEPSREGKADSILLKCERFTVHTVYWLIKRTLFILSIKKRKYASL